MTIHCCSEVHRDEFPVRASSLGEISKIFAPWKSPTIVGRMMGLWPTIGSFPEFRTHHWDLFKHESPTISHHWGEHQQTGDAYGTLPWDYSQRRQNAATVSFIKGGPRAMLSIHGSTPQSAISRWGTPITMETSRYRWPWHCLSFYRTGDLFTLETCESTIQKVCHCGGFNMFNIHQFTSFTCKKSNQFINPT